MKRNKNKAAVTKKAASQKQKWILLEKINDLLFDTMKSSQTA